MVLNELILVLIVNQGSKRKTLRIAFRYVFRTEINTRREQTVNTDQYEREVVLQL